MSEPNAQLFSNPPPDDFQAIKGIGQATAQALIDCNIRSYRDLAAHTPDSLADLLKDRLPNLSAGRIAAAGWIEQAHNLTQMSDGAEKPETTQAKGPEPFTVDSEDHKPDERIKRPQEMRPQGRAQDWKSIADFYVSFGYRSTESAQPRLCTEVHHYQEDISHVWDNPAVEQLCSWMAAQAGLQVEPAISRNENLPTEESYAVEDTRPAEFELLELWVQAAPGEQEQLQVRCSIQLTAEAQAFAEQETPFGIEHYLVNMENRQSHLMASASARLGSDQSAYPLVHSFPIPPIGDYRLYVVARLMVPTATPALFQGPVIHITPAKMGT